MIVLDTNVLSEALKPSPDEALLRWLAEQNREVVFYNGDHSGGNPVWRRDAACGEKAESVARRCRAIICG
jgi:hypothetical protein